VKKITDSVIFFTGSKVVHMGDHFFADGFPFVDTSSGGTISGYLANVEKVLVDLPADTRVIPGHGQVTGVAELKAWLEKLKETRAAVKAGLDQKKTADQLKKDKVLAKWSKMATPFIDEGKWIDGLVADLQGTPPAAPSPAK
jgi:glyoxylase-like metal-dependent hydrolase (beta-lactamase superfamily II)